MSKAPHSRSLTSNSTRTRTRRIHRNSAVNRHPEPGSASGPALLLFNKPFDVLCQFTDTSNRATLANYLDAPGYYPAGRLDRDSEGLLLLTNDGSVQRRISDPRFKMIKRYLVQVEGDITETALAQLNTGVMLKDGGSRAINAKHTQCPEQLWQRHPPVRFRKHIPTSWIELGLDEGRNRQVRRMTAAVGFPTLRLIRTAIGACSVWSLAPGAFAYAEFDALLRRE